MNFLTFGSPFLLLALVALPLIWWLLRAIPPRPRQERFPPFILLKKLRLKKETPNRTPWWLLLLRLLIAALVIIALAHPVWQPQKTILDAKGPLVIMIDNDWASASDWTKRIEQAQTLLRQSADDNRPVYLIATAEPQNQNIGPESAKVIADRLSALTPRALPVDRQTAFGLLEHTFEKSNIVFDLAYFSDGLKSHNDDRVFTDIANLKLNRILLINSDLSTLAALDGLSSDADSLTISAIRPADGHEASSHIAAYDIRNHRLGETDIKWQAGETRQDITLSLPLELRNDIAYIRIDNQNHAGATYLVDSSNRRKRVALLSISAAEMTQPLLNPLYYVAKSLENNSDLVLGGNGELNETLLRLLAQNPSVFIMGDVVNLPKPSENALNEFMLKGGTLIRFAGPNLAAAASDDSLLPVQLRRGERSLGGAMSWAAPQKIGTFAANSPFSDLSIPDDVTISRQILAQPSSDLFDRTWISLEDGTPLVTSQKRGQGRLIFIHTAADMTWSNLPVSGFFVEMMHRLIASAGMTAPDHQLTSGPIKLSPWRTLSAKGELESPPAYVTPVAFTPQEPPHPAFNQLPGLYGMEDNLSALNLLEKNTMLEPLVMAVPGHRIENASYENDKTMELAGPLLTAALMLFAFDCLVTLLLSGILLRRRLICLILLSAGLGLFGPAINPLDTLSAYAQSAHGQAADGKSLIEAAATTHLAYVKTGNREIDETSQSGLESLSLFIQSRTTISPGKVIGLDLEKDELAFYPLIYWPIDETSPMPSDLAIRKINAFMQNGGTILFDTRDQLNAGMDLHNSVTPQTQRLRDILATLNIPPLEPAPTDHVIARSFYIMPDFPGRYRGSPLWIEQSDTAGQSTRPIHAGDGVSSILITGNDLAGAWAHNNKGGWKYTLIPDDQMQRIWAFRGGLNIIMYMLTGNYKADQVHVPALLERLGKEP